MMTPAARSATSVLIGTALIGPFLLPGATWDGLGGAAFLLSPFLAFALAGRRLRITLWVGCLAVLVAGSAYGLVAVETSTSSTASLIFVMILPAQWVLCLVAAAVASTQVGSTAH